MSQQPIICCGVQSAGFALRRVQVLEALALREEPPEEADLEDETLPDFAAELVQPFKASVGTADLGEGNGARYGEDFEPP